MSNALMVAASKCTTATAPGISAALVPGTMNINGVPKPVVSASQMIETICVTTDIHSLIESALLWEPYDDQNDTVPDGEKYVFSAIFGDGYNMDICCTGTDNKPIITAILYDDCGREMVVQKEDHFLGKHTIHSCGTEYICSMQPGF